MLEAKRQIRCMKWLLCSAIVFYCFLIMSEDGFSQARDNKDYCRSAGHTVIFLIDVTTPYDQTDKSAIVRMTDEIFSSIKGGDKLVIRTITDSHTHSERLIERCIPNCSEEG